MSHPPPLDPSSYISSYPSQLPPQQYPSPQAYSSGYGSPFTSQESLYPPGAYPSQLPPQQYPQQQQYPPQYQSPQQYPSQLPPQQYPSQLPQQQFQGQQQFSGYSPNPYAPNSPNPYFNGQPQEQQATYDINATPVSVPYKIYWNTLAGIGAGLMERGDKALNSGFPVYEINLNYIDSVFAGKKQPWNTKYDNAIKIYGPGIQSKLVRGTIKVQHTALYSASLQNQKGVISGGNDLLEKVLHYGWREGRYYFYTYVIVGGKWRFTETGLSTLKDMISKHAMHANCAREVIYAGEFHVQRTPDGNNYKLIIDNNSGTFAPDLNDLPKLEQLFRKNFPGLIVEAYDRADPRLKTYVETIKAFNNSLIGQGGRN